MFDKELVLDTLQAIEMSLVEIADWTGNVKTENDFTDSQNGMILFNAVCMKLQHIGEEIKSIEKRTDGKLLSHYDSVPWQNIMRLRDKIAHHYTEMEADKIFDIVKDDLEPLLKTIRQIIKDVEQNN